MTRWKSWKFGANARKLPIIKIDSGKDSAEWAKLGLKISPRNKVSFAHCQPSKSLSDSLQKIFDDPTSFLVKSRRDSDIAKYAQLYTGENYSIRETFDVVARNCWVHTPSGTVITQNREIIEFSSHWLKVFYEGHSETSWDEAPLITEPTFKMSTTWSQNYVHWLIEGLPNVEALEKGDSRQILLDRNSPPFQKESLALLGYSNTFVPEPSLLWFKELHFVSTNESGVPDPSLLLKLKEQLIQAVGKTLSIKRQRLYISRQRNRRHIKNHAEVLNVLEEFGFEEIFCEDMTFAEQIQLFSKAEAIFGPHGAGTANILFAPKGTPLIEAFNPHWWVPTSHRIASIVGAPHYHLFAGNASKNFDLHIDPDLLKRTLDFALNCPQHS